MADKEPDKEAVKTAEALAAVENAATEEKEQPVEETDSAEKPVKTPDESQEAPEEKPDAKAFQAMRKEIKDLKEQLTTKSAEVEPEVEPLVPKIETPLPQGIVDKNQYFNSETGEFDADGYANAVEQKSVQSAAAITRQLIEEERQTNEAQALYPAINPSSKDFDKILHKATSALLLQSMVQGDKLTVKEATEMALGLSKKALKEAAETGAKQELENIAAKEKASLEATASSGRATSDYSDIERLSEKTRQGGAEGAEALSERLKRSGF